MTACESLWLWLIIWLVCGEVDQGLARTTLLPGVCDPSDGDRPVCERVLELDRSLALMTTAARDGSPHPRGMPRLCERTRGGSNLPTFQKEGGERGFSMGH